MKLAAANKKNAEQRRSLISRRAGDKPLESNQNPQVGEIGDNQSKVALEQVNPCPSQTSYPCPRSLFVRSIQVERRGRETGTRGLGCPVPGRLDLGANRRRGLRGTENDGHAADGGSGRERR